MEREAIIRCSECRQPIVQGEDFVRFKVPGKASTSPSIDDSMPETVGKDALSKALRL